MKAEEQKPTAKHASKLTVHLRNIPVSTSNISSHVSGASVTFLHSMTARWRGNGLESQFSSFPPFLSTFNSFTEMMKLFVNQQ